MAATGNEHLLDQLVKLGDMMGDGLHYEEPWIAREYEKIARRLYPDVYRERQQKKNKAINARMTELLSRKKCVCGGALKQTRSGSTKCKCPDCGRMFKAQRKKR